MIHSLNEKKNKYFDNAEISPHGKRIVWRLIRKDKEKNTLVISISLMDIFPFSTSALESITFIEESFPGKLDEPIDDAE